MDNNDEIITDNIIFAITKKDLMGIKYLEPVYDDLNFVIEKSLLRIYAQFPPLSTGKVWFDDMESVVTTKTIFNQIMPMSKEKGIIMFYCDSLNADIWNGFHQKGILERELLFHLSKLFSDKIIDNPVNIYVSYYSAATHMWKPGINPDLMYKKIQRPMARENIFIVGEAYSINQQWSQGAIQSVDDLLDFIFPKKIDF